MVQTNQFGCQRVAHPTEFSGNVLCRAQPEKYRYLDIHYRDGVATVTINRVGALNAINPGLLSQLSQVISEIKRENGLYGHSVRALILQGTGAVFSTGVDVKALLDNTPMGITRMAAEAIRVFSDVEGLGVPVVALIDGSALGGGHELAMSAHYRIVTQHTVIGHPEVKLGIIPGFAGLQRLPRLVGPWKAADMFINAVTVDGRCAVSMGLADEFCPATTAVNRAFEVARDLAEDKISWTCPEWDDIAVRQTAELWDLLASRESLELLYMRQPQKQTVIDIHAARKYAARIVLQAMKYGYANGFEKGAENDACLFGEITASPAGQKCLHQFLNNELIMSYFMVRSPSRELDGSPTALAQDFYTYSKRNRFTY